MALPTALKFHLIHSVLSPAGKLLCLPLPPAGHPRWLCHHIKIVFFLRIFFHFALKNFQLKTFASLSVGGTILITIHPNDTDPDLVSLAFFEHRQLKHTTSISLTSPSMRVGLQAKRHVLPGCFDDELPGEKQMLATFLEVF